MRKTWKNI